MGVVSTVGLNKFPEQSNYVGEEVRVMFNYDTNNTLLGKVVREDLESPFQTIIQLKDGRFITSEECQYSFN